MMKFCFVFSLHVSNFKRLEQFSSISCDRCSSIILNLGCVFQLVYNGFVVCHRTEHSLFLLLISHFRITINFYDKMSGSQELGLKDTDPWILFLLKYLLFRNLYCTIYNPRLMKQPGCPCFLSSLDVSVFSSMVRYFH